MIMKYEYDKIVNPTPTVAGDLYHPVNFLPSLNDIEQGIPVLLNPTYEVLKLEIAVVILLIAFAVMLRAAYRTYLHHYHVWAMEQELSEMIEAGMDVNPDDYEIPKMEKEAKTFAIIGGLIVVAGIVLYIL
jgi:hypothetical protein